MKFVVGFSAALAAALVACSGDVNVHGVPEEIKLAAPFCAPPPAKDAGIDASDAATDAESDQ